jgi:hypothetical protein
MDTPCTPDPGPATDAAKRKIKKLIGQALAAQAAVNEKAQVYRILRAHEGASDSARLSTLEEYRTVKNAQADAYKEAFSLIQTLYQVGPSSKDPITIAKPKDSSIGYTEGLTATWNPQVVESGPRAKMSIKVAGKDGPHYTGSKSLNPAKRDVLEGYTAEDGQVFIPEHMLRAALKNPGVIARVLRHESQHFDRLAKGWESVEIEEKAAYQADVNTARMFGLDPKAFKERRDSYSQDITAGKWTSRTVSAKDADVWKEHYTENHINIDDEYAALRAKVENARKSQEELQRLDREERERQEAIRRAAQPRVATRAEMDALAAKCGYRLLDDKRWERNPENTGNEEVGGENIYGFRDDDQHHYFGPSRTPLDLGDLELAFLITRVCQEIGRNPAISASPSCNGSARILGTKASRIDFSDKLNYLFGEERVRSPCVSYFIDNAHMISDSVSFDRAVIAYQAPIKKEWLRARRESQREFEERESEERRRQRNQNRPPRDDNRGPYQGPDHDEVWKRVAPLIGHL